MQVVLSSFRVQNKCFSSKTLKLYSKCLENIVHVFSKFYSFIYEYSLYTFSFLYVICLSTASETEADLPSQVQTFQKRFPLTLAISGANRFRFFFFFFLSTGCNHLSYIFLLKLYQCFSQFYKRRF